MQLRQIWSVLSNLNVQTNQHGHILMTSGISIWAYKGQGLTYRDLQIWAYQSDRMRRTELLVLQKKHWSFP